MQKQRQKIAFIVFLVAGGALVVTWRNSERNAAGSSDSTSTAEAARHVAGIGKIEPNSRIINIGSRSPLRVMQVLVQERDAVEKGMELILLQGYEIHKARIHSLEEEIRETEGLAAATIEVARAKVDMARTELAEIEKRIPHDLRALEMQLERSQAEHHHARIEFARFEKLDRTRAASQESLERSRLNFERSRIAHDDAQSRLQEKKDLVEHQIALAQLALASAEADLEKARHSFRLESIRANLATARAETERWVIRSPIDGRRETWCT